MNTTRKGFMDIRSFKDRFAQVELTHAQWGKVRAMARKGQSGIEVAKKTGFPLSHVGAAFNCMRYEDYRETVSCLRAVEKATGLLFTKNTFHPSL